MGSCSHAFVWLEGRSLVSLRFFHAILGNNEHEKLAAEGPNIPFVIQGENSLFLACLAHFGSKQFGKKSKVFSYSIRAKELYPGWSVWVPQKYGRCVFMYSPVSSHPSLKHHLRAERKLYLFTWHNHRGEGISPVLAKMQNGNHHSISSFSQLSRYFYFPTSRWLTWTEDLWQAVASHDLFFPANHQTMSFWTGQNIYTGQRKICKAVQLAF